MNIKLFSRGSPEWNGAAELVREKYKLNFNAEISPDPDYFMVVSEDQAGGAGRRLMACAGLSFGDGRPFFSEQYLDEPVEQVLSRIENVQVARDTIVEVGSIASIDRSAGIRMIRLVPMMATCLGKQYGFFTLTRQMRQIFQFLSIPAVNLCPADGQRLGAERLKKWGSYYENEPVTGFIRVADTRSLVEQAVLRYQFSYQETEPEMPLRRVGGM